MPVSLPFRMQKLLSVLPRRDSSEISVAEYKKQRSVSFCDITSIRATIHYKDMTRDEIKNTWYSREEEKLIKKEARSEAKLITNGVPAHANTTRRGLEYQTSTEGCIRRKARKLNSISAVLDEQESQRNCIIEDAYAIREMYSRRTARCREEARQRGVQDELDARTNEPEDMELRVEEEQTRRSSKKVLCARTQKSEVVAEVKQLTEI